MSSCNICGQMHIMQYYTAQRSDVVRIFLRVHRLSDQPAHITSLHRRFKSDGWIIPDSQLVGLLLEDEIYKMLSIFRQTVL